jgi:hypothetical protein
VKTIATKVNNHVYTQLIKECTQRGITVSEKLRELVEIPQKEFDEDLLELMRMQIEDTSRTGKEHGFTLCGNGDVEIAERGSRNHIGLRKCPGLTILFHTHPCGTPHPSEMDYNAAKDVDSLLATCVGTSEGVRCYNPRTRKLVSKIPFKN